MNWHLLSSKSASSWESCIVSGFEEEEGQLRRKFWCHVLPDSKQCQWVFLKVREVILYTHLQLYSSAISETFQFLVWLKTRCFFIYLKHFPFSSKFQHFLKSFRAWIFSWLNSTSKFPHIKNFFPKNHLPLQESPRYTRHPFQRFSLIFLVSRHLDSSSNERPDISSIQRRIKVSTKWDLGENLENKLEMISLFLILYKKWHRATVQ